MNSNTLFKKLALVSVLGIGLLSTLLIAPITDNFIEHSKYYVLVFGALLVMSLFVYKAFSQRAVRIALSPVTGVLFLFALSTIASTFFTSNYPVENLMGLGGIFISTSLIAIFGGSILPRDIATKFLYTLTVSSVVITVLSFMQMAGFGPAQLINSIMGITLPTSLAFNVAGSAFIALQVVGLTLLAVIVQIITTKKLDKFFAVTLPILVIGTGLYAWSLLPGKETALVLPSFPASWSVMLDTIRAPKSALIGAGMSSYSSAYQVFKPIWVNGTDNWAVTFTQAASMPLTIVTTMGALGLIAWVLVIFKSLRFHKTLLSGSKAISIFIIFSFLLNLVLPFNTVMLTLQAIAIACLVANEKHRLPLLQMQALKIKMLNKPETLSAKSQSFNIVSYVGTGLAMVLILGVGYLAARSLQAHALMAQSSVAITNNQAVQAYELQQKAVTLNPYFDVFRRRYAATSALIAIALSNKADITETEKQQVSALLQQSVSEARAATTLDALESQNWANLAQIYNNLVGVSEDAVNWAIQSYVTSIETNPNDPLLRLELAAVFVAQEQFEQALGIYDQAINIKPDLPVSHYRKGEALVMMNTPEALREARTAFQRALVLLPVNSEDYILVNSKIEELEKYMQDNNISLEPESEEAVGEVVPENSDDSQETKLSAPSITEQNLNNTNTLTPDSEPVEVNQVPTENLPEEETSDI